VGVRFDAKFDNEVGAAGSLSRQAHLLAVLRAGRDFQVESVLPDLQSDGAALGRGQKGHGNFGLDGLGPRLSRPRPASRASAEGLGKAPQILNVRCLAAHASHGAKLAEQVVQVDAFGAEVDVRSAGPSTSAPEPSEAAGRLEAEAIVLLAFLLVAEQV